MLRSYALKRLVGKVRMTTHHHLPSTHVPCRRGDHAAPAPQDGGKAAIVARRLLTGLFLIAVAGLPLSSWTTLSVVVSDSTFTFGTGPANTWLTPQTTIIRNDGTEFEDFAARISQLTAGVNTWALSATTNGADSIRAQWSTTSVSGPWNNISAYNTDFSIATNLAVNDSINFWFRIQTPTTTTSYSEYSATLTVTATMP